MTDGFDPALQRFLEGLLADTGGVAGTVHLAQGDGLILAAAVRIPPPVIERVRYVPNGKGMAGLAMQRQVPIQTCNLQEDTTGAVKPGARAVDAQAAVALPVLEDGQVTAVIGVAWLGERELDDDALADLHTRVAVHGTFRR